jgi:MFS family permease
MGRIARLYLIWVGLFFFSMAVSATLMNFYLDSIGMTRGQIGIFHAASQFGGLIVALPAIFAFEKMGRRVALVAGAALSTVPRFFTVLSATPNVIIAAEAISGFGAIVFGLASVSLLADASERDNRASVYAVADFTRTSSFLIGSVLAGVIPSIIAPVLDVPAQSPEAYRWTLFTAFAVRLAGVVPLLLIALQSSPSKQTDAKETLPEVKALRYLNPKVLLATPMRVYGFAIPFALMILADAFVFTFINLILREQFGATDATIGLVLGINLLIGSLAVLAAPALSMRINDRAIIIWSTLFQAGCYAVLGLSAGLLMGMLSIFALTIASQVSRVLYRAYTINSMRREDYFIASTMLALAANIGPALAPPISGFVQEALGDAPIYVAAVVLTVAAAIFFAIVARVTAPAKPLPAATAPVPQKHPE